MYTVSNLYLKPVTLFEDWLHMEKITNSAEYLKYDPEKPMMTPAQQEDFWHRSVETGKVMIVGIYRIRNKSSLFIKTPTPNDYAKALSSWFAAAYRLCSLRHIGTHEQT